MAFALIATAQQAGAAILDIYRLDPNVRYKADRSPVTDADHASERIILAALAKLMPDVPVIAEEQTAAGILPETGEVFFLVDPLDGTKEFLKLNGEFSVNIALVAGNKPVFGLIYAPDKSDCYVTLSPGKAFRCALRPAHNPPLRQDLDFVPLSGEAVVSRPMTAIVSRSHLNPETVAFLEKLGDPGRITLGSSLKFGVLARGEADFYPRFGPTSEWDTAAGQAILEATGGCLLTTQGEPFIYGKRGTRFTNPPFIAWRRASDAVGA
ncbi:MAG: 3'(2'),5'-bisphosphate nucleotidase CysQ [Rhodomicrobium sp.]|nr:3'(2'),5'-bisphosphate nucleotidase CysQ [Rhodomicrobium sp.]